MTSTRWQLARDAAKRVGRSGRVIGIDVNPAMLDVARSHPPAGGAAIEWREENAQRLSLADASVDRVMCAQTLQFVALVEHASRQRLRVAFRTHLVLATK